MSSPWLHVNVREHSCFKPHGLCKASEKIQPYVIVYHQVAEGHGDLHELPGAANVQLVFRLRPRAKEAPSLLASASLVHVLQVHNYSMMAVLFLRRSGGGDLTAICPLQQKSGHIVKSQQALEEALSGFAGWPSPAPHSSNHLATFECV